MEETRSSHSNEPVIGFEFKNVLTVNRIVLDIADITPTLLASYIKVGARQIEDRLDILKNLRNDKNTFQPHPSILLGRLSSADHEDEVFTFKGLQNVSSGLYDREVFKKRYRGFWEVIQRSSYSPEIHRNVLPAFPTLEGTWLGLSRSQ